MLRHVPREALAAAAGTTVRWIQKVRNGKTKPSPERRAAFTQIACGAARAVISNPDAPAAARRAAERLLAPGFAARRQESVAKDAGCKLKQR